MILAIDQGTSSTKVVAYPEDPYFGMIATTQEIKSSSPKPGWVEQDPEQIWDSVVQAVEIILQSSKDPINCIGITNQRETTILWNKKTGQPVYNAIIWQCTRTADMCKQFDDSSVQQKTGLPINSYFSATKIKWILDNVVKEKDLDDIVFGTVDTWLLWKLTDGNVHATDYTNASRTLLFNIHTKQWDNELCEYFGIPMHILPKVKPSMDNYGTATTVPQLKSAQITAVAGDQQASLFGHGCTLPGQLKNTYGTGCFVVMNTGDDAIQSKGLLTTLAANHSKKTKKPHYAIEGSIFSGGSTLDWIKKICGATKDDLDIQPKTQNRIYFVPALGGLGAPHWRPDVTGTIFGLQQGHGKNDIIQATLEAIAYQTHDVILTMREETKTEPRELQVDGGLTNNPYLMQFQADILGIPVSTLGTSAGTSQGIAHLAGLQAKVWSPQSLARRKSKQIYEPNMPEQQRQELLAGWNSALQKILQ